MVNQQHRNRYCDSRQQAAYSGSSAATISKSHDDAQCAGDDETDGRREHKISKESWVRGIARKVLMLMDVGEPGYDPRGRVAPILSATVQVEELPGAGQGEENKNRCEEAAQIKVDLTESFHERV